MKVFYKDLGNNLGNLIATHNDESVADNLYGDNVKSFILAQGEVLAREGEEPISVAGGPDLRPIKIPVLDMGALRLKAQASVLAILNAAADTILAGYSQSEILSWPTKEVAAKAYLNNETLTDTQKALLDAELAASGQSDMNLLCKTIVKNAEIFAKVSGSLAGIRSSANVLIVSANTQDDLDTIIAQTEVDAKKAVADALSS